MERDKIIQKLRTNLKRNGEDFLLIHSKVDYTDGIKGNYYRELNSPENMARVLVFNAKRDKQINDLLFYISEIQKQEEEIAKVN